MLLAITPFASGAISPVLLPRRELDARFRAVTVLSPQPDNAVVAPCRRQHEGALVAVHVGDCVLLLRSSYRTAWNFPGGSIRPGDAPELAARRELAEEIGLTTAQRPEPAGDVRGLWDGRRDHVRFFALVLQALPPLRLDNREIVAARLVAPGQALDLLLTTPVRLYIERLTRSACGSERPTGGFHPPGLRTDPARLIASGNHRTTGR